MVEDVVAGDDAAAAGWGRFGFGLAMLQIGFQKVGFVEWRFAPEAEFFGDDVQDGCFAAAVAAVEDGEGEKLMCSMVLLLMVWKG